MKKTKLMMNYKFLPCYLALNNIRAFSTQAYLENSRTESTHTSPENNLASTSSEKKESVLIKRASPLFLFKDEPRKIE